MRLWWELCDCLEIICTSSYYLTHGTQFYLSVCIHCVTTLCYVWGTKLDVILLWLHLYNRYIKQSLFSSVLFTINPKNIFQILDECPVMVRMLCVSWVCALGLQSPCLLFLKKPFIGNFPGCHYSVWPQESCYTETGVDGAYCIVWTEQKRISLQGNLHWGSTERSFWPILNTSTIMIGIHY